MLASSPLELYDQCVETTNCLSVACWVSLHFSVPNKCLKDFSSCEQVLTYHMCRASERGSHTVVNVSEKLPDKTKWLTPCTLSRDLSLLIIRQRWCKLLRSGIAFMGCIMHAALIKQWPVETKNTHTQRDMKRWQQWRKGLTPPYSDTEI